MGYAGYTNNNGTYFMSVMGNPQMGFFHEPLLGKEIMRITNSNYKYVLFSNSL
jgi:hypothetical protein